MEQENITLDKAGAGLPNIERLFIKLFLVPLVRILLTKSIASFLLKREIKIINKLVDPIDLKDRNHSIIIDRTFGIEDDSRRCTVNQVLEHLVIAGNAVQLAISFLNKEREFKKEINIADVKAYGDDNEQFEKFNQFYSGYLEFVETNLIKQSKMTKAHPWFVEFNNFDWHSFMYMHTFVHRRQIEAIIKALGENNE
jgi:uncharacterized protein YdiU (UPF0061 family)